MWPQRVCRRIVTSIKRNYNLHEYQSLMLLKSFGIPTPYNKIANSVLEAQCIATEMGDKEVVVKAQVLAGGRGKGKFHPSGFAGGVHITNPSEVSGIAKGMIGMNLVTKQTTQTGKPCNMVLVMKKVPLAQEFYLAFLLDRKFGGPVLVYSKQGGMDIEEVASRTPEEIYKIPISLSQGLTKENAVEVTRNLGLEESRSSELFEILNNMYRLFTLKDILLLEINPFGVTEAGDLIVCDAKLNFDDNAYFRQDDTFSARDLRQEDPDEHEAHEVGLTYISMDGSIGCLVNGAGLAMATMDLIKLFGASPANFLDVGGGAQVDQIVSALKILQKNPNVDSVFINIFGGIMRCDIIASGLLTAIKQVGFQKPIVARLCGTNWQEAKELILNSKAPVLYETDEELAVKKIVAVSKMIKMARDSGLALDIKYD